MRGQKNDLFPCFKTTETCHLTIGCYSRIWASGKKTVSKVEQLRAAQQRKRTNLKCLKTTTLAPFGKAKIHI